MNSLIATLILKGRKYKEKGYVSLKDAKIILDVTVENPEDNKQDIYVYGERIYSARKCQNWKIYGKDGEGEEGIYVGSKSIGAAKKAHMSDFRRITPGKKTKFQMDLKKILNMYEFEDDEGFVSVRYDGKIEYIEEHPKKTPRKVKKIRIRSSPVEIQCKDEPPKKKEEEVVEEVKEEAKEVVEEAKEVVEETKEVVEEVKEVVVEETVEEVVEETVEEVVEEKVEEVKEEPVEEVKEEPVESVEEG